ncbi:MAG: hypothetical protein C5B58_05845 [Acidobacteria bacterium]|nr:MAG: hypothetical protein C5B58_05845 [Acidobacteriota bacterium]
MVELLDHKEDCLVVVGALHLIGPDGIVELLRKRGYLVVQYRRCRLVAMP